ncbi:MAG: DNA mismatch repair protein MutS [Boseongicola sp.]|nr:Smr/MutS family protein [Boseongicola sp.]NNL18010.1 DNA mismatch repair protein MutS [Boseongicola sp.]
MKRRSPRGLNPDEKDLWEQVAKTATPLEGRDRKPVLFAKKPEKPVKKAAEQKPISQFEIGSAARPAAPGHRLAPSVRSSVGAATLQMDQKVFGRMKRGKTKPEARIDLHGLRLDEAHGALNAFIHRSHSQGRRLVLVITGKGRITNDDGPIPVRAGVLRHQVPDWLSRPPLNALVLQVSEAHQRHGGGGAYYVYLRRS